jgi:glycosyltransferase involved in cell wall biosynthesis
VREERIISSLDAPPRNRHRRTMRRKKLAFLLPDMRGGGAERVALRLIEDFVAAGHEVQLVLMEARGELMPLLPPAVRVFDLQAKRIRNVLVPLRRYLREQQPDAIQVSMWPLTVMGVLAHRLSGSRARVVLSEHITLSKQYAYLGAVGLLQLRQSIRFFYPLADARIAVSRQAADDLARVSGIARESIDVVYNPVGAPPAGAQAGPDVDALWGGAAARIITVGSLKDQKNHALLIRSFARLVRTRPARLMILGEGELRGKLEALARDEGVAEHVVMPGFFADPWPFYLSANLFALSSDYEGYPLVLIEAMRAGLPIVSTDCESGPDEILAGGSFGALVPCGDADAFAGAMARMLDDPTGAHLLRERAEVLSGQDTSDRYLELMTGESV